MHRKFGSPRVPSSGTTSPGESSGGGALPAGTANGGVEGVGSAVSNNQNSFAVRHGQPDAETGGINFKIFKLRKDGLMSNWHYYYIK